MLGMLGLVMAYPNSLSPLPGAVTLLVMAFGWAGLWLKDIVGEQISPEFSIQPVCDQVLLG